jgi:8-amino-7-oxononanoate synthase
MDLFDKCYAFTRAEEAMSAGLYPYFTPIQEVFGNKVKVRGKDMIMVGSNNYLGLMEHPKVKKAAQEAIDRYGVATCGSRFLSGTMDIHEEMERRLALFTGKEAAQSVSTGFQTNQAIIASVAGPGEAIVSDRQVHASIIDACRLSQAEVHKFAHNDAADLERVLKSLPAEQAKLIVVDGVYSMEGDMAPLDKIVPLAKAHNARLLVDEAHGLGVLGRNGRGACEHFGVEKDVDLVMGTFSKSFASLGGFVAGEARVISYIKHYARAIIFSASITPASVATVIEKEPERRVRLWAITAKMKSGFQAMGYDTGATQTPIIPLMIHDDEQAFMLWKATRDMGIFTNPVIYPAVPHGQALIRTSYSATHTDEELDYVLDSFQKAGRALGILK